MVVREPCPLPTTHISRRGGSSRRCACRPSEEDDTATVLVRKVKKRPPRRVDAMLVGTGRLIYAGVRAVAAGCGWPGGRVLWCCRRRCWRRRGLFVRGEVAARVAMQMQACSCMVARRAGLLGARRGDRGRALRRAPRSLARLLPPCPCPSLPPSLPAFLLPSLLPPSLPASLAITPLSPQYPIAHAPAQHTRPHSAHPHEPAHTPRSPRGAPARPSALHLCQAKAR